MMLFILTFIYKEHWEVNKLPFRSIQIKYDIYKAINYYLAKKKDSIKFSFDI